MCHRPLSYVSHKFLCSRGDMRRVGEFFICQWEDKIDHGCLASSCQELEDQVRTWKSSTFYTVFKRHFTRKIGLNARRFSTLFNVKSSEGEIVPRHSHRCWNIQEISISYKEFETHIKITIKLEIASATMMNRKVALHESTMRLFISSPCRRHSNHIPVWINIVCLCTSPRWSFRDETFYCDEI